MRVCTNHSYALLSCCSACRTRNVPCWETYVPHYTIFGWNENKTYIQVRKCVRPLLSDYITVCFCRSLQLLDALRFYKLTSVFPNNVEKLDFLDEWLLPAAQCCSNEIEWFTYIFINVLEKFLDNYYLDWIPVAPIASHTTKSQSSDRSFRNLLGCGSCWELSCFSQRALNDLSTTSKTNSEVNF